MSTAIDSHQQLQPDTLSVVIPCYNEEETLTECVERVLEIADGSLQLEIIIVDDGSRDRSLEAAPRAGFAAAGSSLLLNFLGRRYIVFPRHLPGSGGGECRCTSIEPRSAVCPHSRWQLLSDVLAAIATPSWSGATPC